MSYMCIVYNVKNIFELELKKMVVLIVFNYLKYRMGESYWVYCFNFVGIVIVGRLDIEVVFIIVIYGYEVGGLINSLMKFI